MADYRRWYVAGGTFFFTLVTYRRARFLTAPLARAILGEVMRECRARWPFQTLATVLLPEHLHVLWVLPTDDDRYSMRWAWTKKEFTKRWLAAGGAERAVSRSREARNRRGVWQPRFWEHTVRDENDLERHFDYIHYNPVKHGLVASPRLWPYSTFHRWVRAGTYSPDWGARLGVTFDWSDIESTVGE